MIGAGKRWRAGGAEYLLIRLPGALHCPYNRAGRKPEKTGPIMGHTPKFFHQHFVSHNAGLAQASSPFFWEGHIIQALNFRILSLNFHLDHRDTKFRRRALRQCLRREKVAIKRP